MTLPPSAKVFVYAFLSPGWEEACKELKAGWVALVVARNLAVYVLFYQGAHTLLYGPGPARAIDRP